MATQGVVTSPWNGSAINPCPCGCGGTEDVCCRLDCLVQPRFFCGQLLTDQDMTALVGWTQDKLRLARFRHGWGVVCGLEVHCDPKDPEQIIVGPGYALSCCGDDIVVCEDASLSLADVCQEEKDPCPALRRPAEAQAAAASVSLGGVFLLGSDVRVADIYISYREAGSDPKAALTRTACTGAAPCEYTRTRETFSVNWQHAIPGSDPVAAAAEQWRADYAKCLEVIERLPSALSASADEAVPAQSRADSLRRWLLRWIDDHPLHEFCFVRDWLCDKRTDLGKEPEAVKALFWIIQDCRNAFLECACYECQSSPGVPLARVWLHSMKDARGKPQCAVVSIDSYPPYRRLLSAECWPAPLGQVNIGRAIWHRRVGASAILHGLGVDVTGEEPFNLPQKVSELKSKLEGELGGNLFVPVGGSRKMLIFDAGDLGKRVVGFKEA